MINEKTDNRDNRRPRNGYSTVAGAGARGSSQSCALVPRRVEEWADRSPDAIAVVCENEHLTYHELNSRANLIAHGLRVRGVGPESLVGIFLERSVDMIVALLGILKSGGAYAPLDPVYPPARLATILGNMDCKVLLTQQNLVDRLPSGDAETICIDRNWTGFAAGDSENPEPAAAPQNLAYVIHTSGSTGTPKGVQISHDSLAHLLNTTRQLFSFDSTDTWTMYHSFAFDLSVWEIWNPLVTGGRLVIVPSKITQSPEGFRDLLDREQVTVLNMTPGALRAFISANGQSDEPTFPASVRLIISGGEALPSDLAQTLFETNIAAWNFYGPTEATVWAAAHRITAEDGDQSAVPVGYGLPDVDLRILDSELQPVGSGVLGELFIGGPGLARGYLNCPELTKNAFIDYPSYHDRLYKTGDTAYYRSNGEVVVVGRIDQQVKVRGYRVELGEIEVALNRHPDIKASVVTADKQHGDDRLIAYIIFDQGGQVSDYRLREFLQNSLPEYMIPSVFVRVDSFPLNTNGKIDRRALPPPGVSRASKDRAPVPPRDVMELRIVRLWEQIFGIRPIGIHDNFFDLGGHSLIALRFLAQVDKEFGVKLPLAVLLQAPTIEQLSECLREEEWTSPLTSLVPIQPQGSKPPLFCIHGAGGEVMFYQALAAHLGDDQPLYGLQAQGMDGRHPPHGSVQEMAAHYIHELQTVQPHGPYYLSGASLGGVIAFEMAQQFISMGESVAFLGFFDSFHPNYPRYRPGITRFHQALGAAVQTTEHHIGSLIMLKPGKRWLYAREKLIRAGHEAVWLIQDIGKAIASKVCRLMGKATPDKYKLYHHPLRSAVQAYEPKPYDGTITLFRATRQPIGIYPDNTLGWAPFATGGIVDEAIPCLHASMVSEPRVVILAEKLDRCLASARERGGSESSISWR